MTPKLKSGSLRPYHYMDHFKVCESLMHFYYKNRLMHFYYKNSEIIDSYTLWIIKNFMQHESVLSKQSLIITNPIFQSQARLNLKKMFVC